MTRVSMNPGRNLEKPLVSDDGGSSLLRRATLGYIALGTVLAFSVGISLILFLVTLR